MQLKFIVLIQCTIKHQITKFIYRLVLKISAVNEFTFKLNMNLKLAISKINVQQYTFFFKILIIKFLKNKEAQTWIILKFNSPYTNISFHIYSPNKDSPNPKSLFVIINFNTFFISNYSCDSLNSKFWWRKVYGKTCSILSLGVYWWV